MKEHEHATKNQPENKPDQDEVAGRASRKSDLLTELSSEVGFGQLRQGRPSDPP